MTEEEFKKVMTKVIAFIVIALIILIIIGILVFNKSGKTLSIFSNQKEIDDYKKKVQEINSDEIIEEETSENIVENTSEEVTPESEVPAV